MKKLIMSAVAVALAAQVSAPAAAQTETEEYRIDSNSTRTLSLRVCAPGEDLEVRGDHDTDLDFVVTNAAGRTVHSDYDSTDITFATLTPSGGGCENFRLAISNLGNVYNMATVTLRSRGRISSGGGGSGDGRNRDMVLRNQTGETISYLHWTNTGETGWGPDRLGSSVLSAGQQWNVTVDDATGACSFDFKAVTASDRSIERRNVNVCTESSIDFK